jgi:SAM-dependent methyltransferase
MTHAHTHHHHSDSDQAEFLTIEAAVFREQAAAIVEWLPLPTPPSQIVDLGAGTGAGTFALLGRFPKAQVTAVDVAAAHVRRLRDEARVRGVEDRVQAVEADLDDAAWPDLGTPDLVWAAASLHHLARPEDALRAIREILAPDGLLAVVEVAAFARFLPEDAFEDRPGLEERCHAIADRLRVEHLPYLGADWRSMLAAAGFTVEGERTVAVRVEGSQNDAVGAFALASLRRLRESVGDALDADDLAALDRLLDAGSPHYLLRRYDLTVRAERTVWAARPAGA